MTDLTRSEDHAERGLGRLLEQFQSSGKLKALIASYLHQVQRLEDACWEVILYRTVDSAEGAQLDVLGRIVGRGRNDLTDDAYRLAVRARIRINRSFGTPNDLLEVAALSLPDDTVHDYGEAEPATVVYTVQGVTVQQAQALFDALYEAKCVGVKLFVVAQPPFPVSQVFSWSAGSTPEVDAQQGWGSTAAPGTGGHWSFVLSS